MSETQDRWYVNVTKDDVRMMTLDEIVEAFEEGVISRETLVVEVGGNQWQPLAEVADLGDDEPAPPAAAPVARASAAPAGLSSWPPQAVSRVADSAWPPVAVARAQPSTISPSSFAASAPLSTVPVVNDLDLDFGAPKFKSGKRNVAVFALLAVALAGGGAFALTRGGAMEEISSPVPVPAAAPFARVTDPTPVSSPKSEPTPAAPASDGSERLNEEQKRALLSADKDRGEKRKVRATAPRSGGGAKTGGSSNVFKANGNANDPLNPSL